MSIQSAYAYPILATQIVQAKWTDLNFSICIFNSADPKYTKLFVQAVEEWEKAWPHFNYVIRENQSGCYMNVNVVKDYLSREQHSEGNTKIKYWEYGRIISADIIIPTQMSKEVKKGEHCCIPLVYEFTERKFYLTALHEFGHALGLGHPADDGQEPFDVMRSMGEHPKHIISAVSVRTLDSIYGTKTLAKDHPIEVKPSVTLDVQMDKSKYMIEDVIKVSGKVSKQGTGKVMLLKLLEGEPSMSIHTVANFKPNNDGSFSVDIDFMTDKSGKWMLLVQYMGVSKSLLFDVEELPYNAIGETDRTTYSVGDVVKINGSVTRYTSTVSIDIINPDGVTFANMLVPVLDKKFNAQFTLKESRFTIEGEWKVRFTSADAVNDFTFVVRKSINNRSVVVQAKQIGDLLIMRVSNMADTGDIAGFKVWIPDSSMKAVKAPDGWMGESIENGTLIFSTNMPINASDKMHFILMIDEAKPSVNWLVYDINKNALAEGMVSPLAL